MTLPAILLDFRDSSTFENLCYTRGFNRTEFSPSEPTSNPGTLPPGLPRVTTTFFDAVVDVTSMEVRDTGVSADAAVCMDQRGDATCRAFDDLDGTNVQLYLPNGRRTTAHVIEAGADAMARGESGLEEDTGAGPHPGSKYTLVTDAVGATTNYITPGPTDSRIPASFTTMPGRRPRREVRAPESKPSCHASGPETRCVYL